MRGKRFAGEKIEHYFFVRVANNLQMSSLPSFYLSLIIFRQKGSSYSKGKYLINVKNKTSEQAEWIEWFDVLWQMLIELTN
jgi:hypothetical protein